MDFMKMRPVLIGQAPGPNTPPKEPLYPFPESSAGARLRRFAGLSLHEYLFSFDRKNLLNFFPGPAGRGDAFPLKLAKRSAETLREDLLGRHVVLVGRKVGDSFGIDAPYFEWTDDPTGAFEAVVVPHTSGRCKEYDKYPENQERLRRVLTEAMTLSSLRITTHGALATRAAAG